MNAFILKKFLFIIVLLFRFCIQAKAQTNYVGTWNVLNTEYAINNKVSVWAEGQLRSQKFINDFYYHEVKTGVNIRPNKSFGILIGMGQYATYSNGGNFKTPVISHEFRLWEQFTLVNNIGKVKIEHRYRIEQRWRNDEYRNRFRYRLNPIIPINKKSIQNHTLFVTLYDEIFITNQPSYFERNRFFIGAGYKFSEALAAQTGYIYQFDYKINDETGKAFFNLALLYTIDLSKKSKDDFHPTTND